MTDIIAIIPARSGSKSLTDKNIQLLSGHPLIAYSIAAARLSREIDRIIVSTNSEKYADIASSAQSILELTMKNLLENAIKLSGKKKNCFNWWCSS